MSDIPDVDLHLARVEPGDLVIWPPGIVPSTFYGPVWIIIGPVWDTSRVACWEFIAGGCVETCTDFYLEHYFEDRIHP